MYLMYVDESGDCGLVKSPSPYFALSGLVLHELRWRDYLSQLVEFRRRMRAQHSLKLRRGDSCIADDWSRSGEDESHTVRHSLKR
jgi:hypothetical protein